MLSLEPDKGGGVDTGSWLKFESVKPGDLGKEEIVVAQGTKHEQTLRFLYPAYTGDQDSLIFRALIEEIHQLRDRIAKLENK